MKIPQEIIAIGAQLQKHGYDSYLVGGCVRDLLLGIEPKDWDMTSACLPEKVADIFPHSHYDNTYGTVRIVNDDAVDKRVEVIELTTFREDLGYSDGRRPDKVEFSSELSKDLERRDFTINALAYKIDPNPEFQPDNVIDEHGGIKDLEEKVIRTVGNPDDRFAEDALRLIRAVRFGAQLSFMIESDTIESIIRNSATLSDIAIERVADEFNKLMMTNSPAMGVELLHRTNLLQAFIPELEEAIGVTQNQAHSYTVWEHLLRTCQAAADKGYRLELRIAALFHDIAKPTTREVSRETSQPTFYNHEFIGAKMTKSILKRMKYSTEHVSQITTLVRWHMFFSDPDEVTLSAVRRLIANVGPDLIWDLMNLRVCDRIGTGRPKEQPYRFRKYQAMIEEASRQPTSVKMLNISGDVLISELEIKPGRIIGDILHALMNEVLDDPSLNTTQYLLDRSKELLNMDEVARETLAKAGRDAINDKETQEITEIRDKYHVK